MVDGGEHIVNEWSTFLPTGETVDVEADLRRASAWRKPVPVASGTVSSSPAYPRLAAATFLLSPATEER